MSNSWFSYYMCPLAFVKSSRYRIYSFETAYKSLVSDQSPLLQPVSLIHCYKSKSS